jgi:two-component system sensor histidine kinase TctE
LTAPADPARARPSLLHRLLRDVMVPLALTWAVGTAVMIGVASHFTQLAFDRSLLDDAYLVASNVHMSDNRLALALSPRELGSVLFDQNETAYLALVDPAGAHIEGTQGLQPSPPVGEAVYRFSYIRHDGRNLRAVTLRRERPAPFMVVMAQTTQSRRAMLQRLLAWSAAPQLALLAVLAWWLRRAIARDMQPLAALQQAVDRRDARDLAPVDADASTRDVERLAQAINSLLTRLDDSVRAQREFAGNVAHELRTPLAGIRALADYGLSHADPAVWRGQLQRIVGSQARASRLVDQLLALALADEARAHITLQPVALDVAVRDAVLRFLPRADAQGVDLGARGAEDPVWVMAEPTLLEGLLNNLLDNALRYGRPADGSTPRVTVEVACDAREVVLAVVDNGPGLPPGTAQRLARRWAQGEEGIALRQGAGLGLAIVTQYAALMDARWSVSAPPQGPGLSASVVLARAAVGQAGVG